MKAASLVSRDFLQMIRTTKKFHSTAVLLVTEKSALEIGNCCKSPREYPPLRGVKIDVAVPIEVLHNINHILEKIEFLSIITLPRKDKLPRGTLSKFFLHVLTSTSNFTNLQIDVRLMHRNLYEVFQSAAVQSSLKNLKNIQILLVHEKNSKCKGTKSLNNAGTFYVDSTNKFATPWLQNTDPVTESTEDIYIVEHDGDFSQKTLPSSRPSILRV